MANKKIFELWTPEAFKKAIFASLEAQFSTLEEELKDFTVGKKDTVEVELRIRDLGYTEYQRILKWLLNQEGFDSVTEVHTTDYFIEKRRYTVDEEKNIIAVIEKGEPKNIDNVEFDTRLSLNVETSFDNDLKHGVLLKKSTYNRKKKRNSFSIKDLLRIDMTEVSSMKKGKHVFNYECEIEFIKISQELEVDQISRNTIKIVLHNIILQRQNSQISYKQDKLRNMIQKLNTSLGKEDSRLGLDYTFLAPARNLKYPDIVTGGLIGGKYRYNVTIKADGIRKLLLFFGSGVWLIYPPHDFNLVGIYDDFLKVDGFMSDGEDVPIENRVNNCEIKSRHLYIPFDTCLLPLTSKRDNDIQSGNQDSRLSKAIDILNSRKVVLSKMGITIMTKDFIELGDSFESMSAAIIKLDKIKDTLCYKTDGFMFTPINARYNTGTDPLPIHERVLTKHPDICKLKLWENLTVDFLVDISTTPFSIIGRGRSNAPTVFEGTTKYPFEASININWDAELFKSIKTSVIVEFEPLLREIAVTDEDGKKQIKKIYMLTPLKVRPDKLQPNRTDYAGAIWDDINDPIDIATFEGKTFRLHRHSLNKVKRDLYFGIPDNADIFEIGTGNGGQLYRWKRFNKILGVEPSSEHIREMNTRLQKYDTTLNEDENKLTPRVQVLLGGAEETERIVNNAKTWFTWKKNKNIKPFYIVSMLSLSFFWKDKDTFNSLVKTVQSLRQAYIKAGGKEVFFLFLTIRGSLVKQLFKEHTNVVTQGKKRSLTLGPCSMILNEKKSKEDLSPVLEVDIKDTIVSSQEEYLVNIKDLKDYFPLIKLKSKSANIEPCMSEAERTYSSLLVYGSAKIGDIKSKISSEEEIITSKKKKDTSSEEVKPSNKKTPIKKKDTSSEEVKTSKKTPIKKKDTSSSLEVKSSDKKKKKTLIKNRDTSSEEEVESSNKKKKKIPIKKKDTSSLEVESSNKKKKKIPIKKKDTSSLEVESSNKKKKKTPIKKKDTSSSLEVESSNKKKKKTPIKKKDTSSEEEVKVNNKKKKEVSSISKKKISVKKEDTSTEEEIKSSHKKKEVKLSNKKKKDNSIKKELKFSKNKKKKESSS
jgi:hypothetical protein